MTRLISPHVPLAALAGCGLVVSALAPAAQAQQRPARGAPAATVQARPVVVAQAKRTNPGKPAAAAAPAGPGGAQAVLLATFGDWGAYASGEGRSKICYALTQPKERLPANLNRDPAYLFVSFRPAENVRNEVAVVMGFGTKDGVAAEAAIGPSEYALITKGPNAWVKNPAEEGQVIATMVKGETLTVKATSGRGNETTDRYSLIGFTKALERAKQECQ